jgi:hypothetical protein
LFNALSSDLGVEKMSKKALSGRIVLRLALLSSVILLLVLTVIGLKYRSSNSDLENIVSGIIRRDELLSQMRINLIKSADIEKAAVMADSDELSRALAEKALQAADSVDAGRSELRGLIEKDRIVKEVNLLQEFDNCWAQSRKIDQALLEFAVENTNIKASSLSFAQGNKAVARFEESLSDLIRKTVSGSQGIQIVKLACDALTGALKIQYLHAPHISAANDEQMDSIEGEIRQSDKMVGSSLKELESLVPEENQILVREAASAYSDFNAVTTEVVKLSRRNTNIKSFELSLGRKRRVTAECDEILNSLQQAVRSRTFDATR